MLLVLYILYFKRTAGTHSKRPYKNNAFWGIFPLRISASANKLLREVGLWRWGVELVIVVTPLSRSCSANKLSCTRPIHSIGLVFLSPACRSCLGGTSLCPLARPLGLPLGRGSSRRLGRRRFCPFLFVGKTPPTIPPYPPALGGKWRLQLLFLIDNRPW